MIVIIDYNVGNLKSVVGAFKRIGLEAVVSRDEKVIKEAKGIVLPGVGTFPTAMKNLEKYHLVDILTERKEAGIPILGICLGMQILFEKGYEVKETKGLGFIPGSVRYMDIDEKIPHMGWNQLHITNHQPILKYVHENDDAYFVHSYMAHIVRSIEDYGIFVELAPNLAGLAEPKENIHAGQSVSVYIKALIPEKMKIKLIIVDTCEDISPIKDMKYFLSESHIETWNYASEASGKTITSVF